MMVNNHWLVVTGTMEFDDFTFFGNFIIPTDELIFFSEGLKPPTRLNQSTLPYIPPAFNGSFSRRFSPAGIGRSLCSDVRKIQGHSVAQRDAERKPFRDAGTEGIFFTGQSGQ